MAVLHNILVKFIVLFIIITAISNTEETRQKVQGSAIFEIVRLRDSEITPEENSR